MPPPVRLAVLNSMFGPDIESSLRRQHALGLTDLDLKDGLYGGGILDLTDAQAETLAGLAADLGMRVHCLSTQLFDRRLENGRDDFVADLDRVGRVAELAAILRPRMVRLLACRSGDRPADGELSEFLDRTAPWLLDCYRAAVRHLRGLGQAVTIENEAAHCILRSPADVLTFFAELGLGAAVSFTWDVQNLWTNGAFPSIEVYERVKPLVAYVHLKGGRAGRDGALVWRSPLRTASWPVRQVTARVIADGVSPVICLNPSHGKKPHGYDSAAEVEDDIAYLREIFDRSELS